MPRLVAKLIIDRKILYELGFNRNEAGSKNPTADYLVHFKSWEMVKIIKLVTK